MNVTITPVNDAPLGTTRILATNEDTALPFTEASFGFNDPIEPTQQLDAVIITSLPANGTLRISGVDQTSAPFTVLRDNIPTLTFQPAPQANGDNYASFQFRVRDNGGETNGGVNTSVSPNTIIVNVTSINDAPVGTDRAIPTILRSTAGTPSNYTLTVSDFGFNDPNDNPDNAPLNVIVNPPTSGVLNYNGLPV